MRRWSVRVRLTGWIFAGAVALALTGCGGFNCEAACNQVTDGKGIFRAGIAVRATSQLCAQADVVNAADCTSCSAVLKKHLAQFGFAQDLCTEKPNASLLAPVLTEPTF